MGRKTNSVSLRLKKTNKDFIDCWYSDSILYRQNLSRSLKMKDHLEGTLKSAAVPCAHLSFIGAFKKSNILVGYFDPENTRKQRCESLYLKMYPRFPQKESPINRGVDRANTANLSKPIQSNFLSYKGSKSQNISLQSILSNINSIFATPSANPPQQKRKAKIGKTGNRKKYEHSQIFTGYAQFYCATPLGLIPSRTFIYIENKPPLKNTRSELYKSLSVYPQMHTSPQKFLSVFSKTTQVEAEKKVTFPLYNLFLIFGYLASLKNVFKYLGKKAYREMENQSYFWFSQRKSFFCVMETLKDPDVKLAQAILPLSKNYGKNKDLRRFANKEVRTAGGSLLAYSKDVFLEGRSIGPKISVVQNINPQFSRLQNLYSSFGGNLFSISLYKSTYEKSSALFLAYSISYYLERRILFRRLKRQLLRELSVSKRSYPPSISKTKALENYNLSNSQEDIADPQLQSKFMWRKYTEGLGHLGIKMPISENTQNFFINPQYPSASMLFENVSKIAGIRISCSGRVGGRSKKAQRSRKETLMFGETGLHVFSSKLDFASTYAETGFGLVGIQVWICYK